MLSDGANPPVPPAPTSGVSSSHSAGRAGERLGTLVIETATAACSVALIADGEPVARLHEIVGRGHAERLMPMVAEVLAGRSPPARLLVDCGPGSFTGVRVGLAAARALGLAWSVPVDGYSSLALIAAMAGVDGPVAAAMPGGHGELFVQRFAGSPLAPLEVLRSLPLSAAAAYLVEEHIAGEGAAAVIDARGGGIVHALLPDAGEAWRLSSPLRRLAPSPIYGRAPDAKVAA